MNKFDVIKKYSPKGDQPKAIQNLSDSIREGNKRQTLLGVTGSEKLSQWLVLLSKFKNLHWY